MTKPPCKDCKQREIGCHSNCDLYKQYKQKFESEKEEISRLRSKERLADDFAISSCRHKRKRS